MHARQVIAALVALLLCTFATAAAQDDTQLARKPSARQQQVDRFTESTGAMSYAELAASLNKYSEGYELVQMAGLTPGPTPMVRMQQVLADRRLAKMYEILSKEGPEVAAERATALFSEKLKRQIEETRLTRAQDPKADPSFGTAVHLHAVNAALFLCAITCDKTTVLKNLDEWHAAFPGDDQRTPGPDSSGLPDSLFVLNIYLLLLHRDGASQAELKQRVDELKREFGRGDDDSFRFEMLRFYRWNTQTNEWDDDKKVLLQVPGFRDWALWLGLSGQKPDEIKRLMARGRSWIE